MVHVVRDLESLLGVYVCKKPLPELQSELEIEGKAKLQRLGRECFTAGARAREIVLSGIPWREIVAAAIRHRVDAIVIGSHSEERPEHRILGSTVAHVIRHAPCSVVVVPPDLGER